MPPPLRRSDVDACPGALRLHAAADGPLARVRLPGGMLSGAQLAVLGALARECGDGRLELTSRANVQLRALQGEDPTALAALLTQAGLLPSQTHETVRNIAAPPLAGALIRGLVQELDRALCADPELAALPGRFLFAIGEVPLDADVSAAPLDPVAPSPLAQHKSTRSTEVNAAVLFAGQ
ncbi:MAG TPA: sulfite reductase subunit beta, partial [Actinoplanes sp.]